MRRIRDFPDAFGGVKLFERAAIVGLAFLAHGTELHFPAE
jgi:hypothetical protein